MVEMVETRGSDKIRRHETNVIKHSLLPDVSPWGLVWFCFALCSTRLFVCVAWWKVSFIALGECTHVRARKWIWTSRERARRAVVSLAFATDETCWHRALPVMRKTRPDSSSALAHCTHTFVLRSTRYKLPVFYFKHSIRRREVFYLIKSLSSLWVIGYDVCICVSWSSQKTFLIVNLSVWRGVFPRIRCASRQNSEWIFDQLPHTAADEIKALSDWYWWTPLPALRAYWRNKCLPPKTRRCLKYSDTFSNGLLVRNRRVDAYQTRFPW